MEWAASHVFREKTPYELADFACTGPGGRPWRTPAEGARADRRRGAVAVQLRDSGYRLRFFAGARGQRTRIEIHDGDGRDP